MKIEVGRERRGQKVCFNIREAVNKNVAIYGAPGVGKSVEIQKIALEIIHRGATALMFDHHQVLDDREIFWKYKQEFTSFMHEISAYEAGIPCDLFEPITYPDGGQEHPMDAVCAAVDAFDRALKLGSAQKAVLRTAIAQMAEGKMYGIEGFKAIDKVLEDMDDPTSTKLRDKLYPLIIHNVFCPGNFFIQEGRINVLRLSKFDLATQDIVAEIVLAYIWRLAATNYFKRNELFLFVDEFQNLPSGGRSSLAQMLSEGRKFGINLILATQQLPRSNATVVQQRLMQSGLILYFRPSTDQIRAAAKLIDPEKAQAWMKVLQGLGKGEFVASGTLEISGHQVKYPLRVSAYERPYAYTGRLGS